MLFELINYTADISYLTNVFIREYDISKCNINVLFSKGVIDKNTYDYLYSSERMVRQSYIGKLQKDNRILKILKDGIIEAKQIFFNANNIKDSDVLSIKNDAVFLINKKALITKFNLIEFKEKSLYTSFYKINNMELYYYYNNITKAEYLDVKGISDINLAKHDQYFLQFIKDIFYSIQVNGSEITLRMLKEFYNEYISLKLPIEFYRRFDSTSNYHFKYLTNINTGFEAEYIINDNKNNIDISYNLSIIIQLQKYIMSMYFNKNK